MGNDVITHVISANQRFTSTFSMQIFKFQRCRYKLSFLFPPHRQSTPQAYLQAIMLPKCHTSEGQGERRTR